MEPLLSRNAFFVFFMTHAELYSMFEMELKHVWLLHIWHRLMHLCVLFRLFFFLLLNSNIFTLLSRIKTFSFAFRWWKYVLDRACADTHRLKLMHSKHTHRKIQSCRMKWSTSVWLQRREWHDPSCIKQAGFNLCIARASVCPYMLCRLQWEDSFCRANIQRVAESSSIFNEGILFQPIIEGRVSSRGRPSASDPRVLGKKPGQHDTQVKEVLLPSIGKTLPKITYVNLGSDTILQPI